VLSGVMTVCQVRAPRALRARIASLSMLGVGGGHSLGLVIQGWLGDRVGLRLVTAVTGMLLLAIVASVRLLRPALLESMDQPAAPVAPGSDASPAMDPAGGLPEPGRGRPAPKAGPCG
jgi:predicted MFS family arabinose efflux permease